METTTRQIAPTFTIDVEALKLQLLQERITKDRFRMPMTVELATFMLTEAYAGDTKSVARERLVSVAGEEFARNLDEKGEAALYDYLYIPDEYMPVVDYMRQKHTTEGMEDAMSERMKPAMDAAREIVGKMSPTTGADGQQEVQIVRDGEKTYVVRRQVGDVLMVTPISVNEDGTIDWSQYDGEVTRALKWKPQFSFERMNGEDIVREMVPEYTMERERIFGAPTEEEVLAVEAEGRTNQSSQIGGSPVGEMGTDGKNRSEGMIGRSLSEEEADSTIRLMQERATEAPDIELTPENWLKEFGEDGKIETPIGEVKMGENQYFKLARKGREGKLGMIKPTLTSPDFIIEDERPANGGSSERDTSFVFVKTFTRRDGERYYHFTSVTVSKDGQEVVISNQERSTNRISKLLREGKVAWIDSAFSLHPMAQIEEPIPLNDSSRPTNIDNQPTRLGISSSERFEGKGTENNPNVQGNAQENSERANLSAQWAKDGRLSDGNGGSVWAPKEQTVEKLTEDMGGDRTAARAWYATRANSCGENWRRATSAWMKLQTQRNTKRNGTETCSCARALNTGRRWTTALRTFSVRLRCLRQAVRCGA